VRLQAVVALAALAAGQRQDRRAARGLQELPLANFSGARAQPTAPVRAGRRGHAGLFALLDISYGGIASSRRREPVWQGVDNAAMESFFSSLTTERTGHKLTGPEMKPGAAVYNSNAATRQSAISGLWSSRGGESAQPRVIQVQVNAQRYARRRSLPQV
jgi:hypothetical protein